MSLRDRLNRLNGQIDTICPAEPKQLEISRLRRKIDAVMSRAERMQAHGTTGTLTGTMPLTHAVSGEIVDTATGQCFLSRSRLEADAVHGHRKIGDLARPSMEAAAFLAGTAALKDFSIQDALFLDTETTGLAGGTGTFPFLVGLGWFDAGGFAVDQLFARDFSDEPAMLACLCELASRKKFLVTFNGKAYDMTLLAARLVLNRRSDPFSGMPQIDLLYPSRRIFAHRLENARLVTLEASVLGVKRHQDVPGHEIPQRYFDWLKSRDGRLMADVFAHNRLDVVSMACLLKQVTDLVTFGHPSTHAHHGDLLSVARLYHDRGDLAAAGRIFETLCRSDQIEVSRSARRWLSLIYKKTNQWPDAVVLWQKMIALDPHDTFAAEELAKWYEHHDRRLDLAVEAVQRVLVGNDRLGHPQRLEMEHRMRRLLLKRRRRERHL
jgi:uncharacterized protein YprB with RNaseH-like and TPR domain